MLLWKGMSPRTPKIQGYLETQLNADELCYENDYLKTIICHLQQSLNLNVNGQKQVCLKIVGRSLSALSNIFVFDLGNIKYRMT